MMRIRLFVACVGLVFALVAACGPSGPQPLRLESENMLFRITADPSPPYARERTVWKVVIRDKKTREPIEGGDGQLYATSRDAVNVYDALVPCPELGSYCASLRFVTAGDWAVAVRFRRDSTRPLEKVEWYQEVRAAREEPGN